MDPIYRIAMVVRSPRDRTRLRDILLNLGHEIVLNATSLEELRGHCATASPQLIVTDIGKCGLDCLEVVEAILEEQRVPFIVVACADGDNIDQAKTHGALAFLTKPVRQSDLSAAISIAMRQFEELQSARLEVVDVRRALEERKYVERAKGIIMNSRQLDEPSAFKWLQQFASSHRQTLVDVAKSIVLTEQALNLPARVSSHKRRI